MDLIADFLRHLEHNDNASPQTLRCYRTDLMEFEEFLSHGLVPRREASLLTLDHHVVREYLSHLHGRGVSRARIHDRKEPVRLPNSLELLSGRVPHAGDFQWMCFRFGDAAGHS